MAKTAPASARSTALQAIVPSGEIQLASHSYTIPGGYAGANITQAWRMTTGAGATVALIDDGFDPSATAHYGAFSTLLSKDFSGSGTIAEPSGGYHGTTTSGLIGAGGNAAGTWPVGVAPDATVVGLKVAFGNSPFSGFVNALTYATQVAGVVNNSWAFNGYGVGEYNDPYFQTWYQAVANAVGSGRGGLGEVIVFAAGNDRANANNVDLQPINADPRAIAVAATDAYGNVAWFSTPGAALLVSAIGVGDYLPLPGTYQAGTGNGTSYSAPTISGIAALMLSVNPNLGWRDVQEILADSAYAPATSAAGFVTNRAQDWNGGGRQFSNDLGYGVVDASVAVDLASVWTAQSTSANIAVGSASQTTPLSIATGGTAASQVGFAAAERVQHVMIGIDDTRLPVAYTKLVLTSPLGTQSVLANDVGLVNGSDKTGGLDYAGDTLTSNAFWGENAAGTWTLTATNASGQASTITDWTLTVWGDTGAAAAAPLVFTPSYAALAAADPTRTVITPTATGATTMDLVDLPGATTLNLRGGAGMIDGVAVTLVAGLLNVSAPGVTGNLTVTDGASAGTFLGGLGTNLFYVNNSGDLVSAPSGSTTTIITSVNYALHATANVQVLQAAAGAAGLTLTANNDAVTLIGGTGADTLISGTGVDALVGGGGADNFYVNNTADTVTQAAGGTGTVITSVNYALQTGSNVQVLQAAAGARGLRLTANNATVTLIGGTGNDTLVSGTGVDALVGGGGRDIFYVNNTADTVTAAVGSGSTVYASVSYALQPGSNVTYLRGTGTANLTLAASTANTSIFANQKGNDSLVGGTGNDVFYSSAAGGIDTMIGGGGTDTFYVYNSADAVQEAAGGTATVIASVNYTLQAGSNVTYLRGAGSANLTLTGNADSNVITANAAGNDTLIGGGGNDVFYSSASGGIDTLIGGGGTDTFYVYNSADIVTEAAGGTATVIASVNYTLQAGSNVRNLRGTGSAGLTLTGNSDNNVITSSTTGKDTLIGGGGADTFYVYNGADIVQQAAGGTGTIITSVSYALQPSSNVQFLRANPAATGITLTGNGAGDTLVAAGAGNNTLVSGVGKDTMTGGTGADIFQFAASANSIALAAQKYVITNFSDAKGDIIDLHLLNAVTGAATDQAFTFLGTSAFDGHAGELRYAVSGSNAFVYGDTTGTGAANFAIQLTNVHALTAADFIL